jgi:hypothetical protein
MKMKPTSPKFSCGMARGGLKSCLSSWKSDKSDFHELSSGLQPRSMEVQK